MPAQEEEQEPVEAASDEDQRIHDWTECFQIFQDHDELEPHHNVEIKELFSLTEIREGDEIIFYHRFGSFWLQYSPELWQDGVLAQGSLHVKPALLELVLDTSQITPESLMEGLARKISEEDNSYLEIVDELDTEIGTVMDLEVPRDYNKMKVVDTVFDGVAALNVTRDSLPG